MTRWHRRACPVCGLADDAGAFRLLDPHASNKAPDADDPKRVCHGCGAVGPTSTFRIYDELLKPPPHIVPNPDRCIVCGRQPAEHHRTYDRRPVSLCDDHDDDGSMVVWTRDWLDHMTWRNNR
jgi:hypothetical protein